MLLALVDANYKFLYVDVGTNGRISDGGVFRKCSLFRAMASNKLNFPEEKPLPGEITPMPHVIIGDAAFPLMKNILKPFPFRNMSWDQRIFNYRLSRARRVVENAFGILANRFRILLHIINLHPDKVRQITLTCVALHNFLRKKCAGTYIVHEENIDRRFIFRYGLSQQQGNRAGIAVENRKAFINYFNTVGAVPWQNDLA